MHPVMTTCTRSVYRLAAQRKDLLIVILLDLCVLTIKAFLPCFLPLLVPVTMTTMKAAMFDEHGGPEKLYIGEAELPEPGEGEVLIKVYAAGVNRTESSQVAGIYTPPPNVNPNLGLEASGHIVKLGPGCSKWTIGDRVMCLLGGGGQAEFVVAHEGHMMPVPSHMTMIEAATIPEAWLVAYQLLHFLGHVTKGDKVLIHAAGGGIGTAAIQLTRLAGAEALATAGTVAKLDMARKLGAAAAFNYKEVDFAEKVMEYTQNSGVDLILDCVGGSYWDQNMRVIVNEGRWIVYGLLGDPLADRQFLKGIFKKRLTLMGTNLRPRSIQYKTDLVQAFTRNVWPHFGDKLRPVTANVYPLENIAESHQLILDNVNIGKVVLLISDEAKCSTSVISKI